MVAEEPSYTQLDHHGHAADRRIGDPAPVAAVDARGGDSTPGAVGSRPSGTCGDDHSICYPFNPLDHRAQMKRTKAMLKAKTKALNARIKAKKRLGPDVGRIKG